MNNIWDFTGRATRAEYWKAWIFGFPGGIVLSLFLSLIGLIIAIPLYLWAIAATVSRIRDTGHSVLWILAYFVPYIGFVVIVVFGCLESKKSG